MLEDIVCRRETVIARTSRDNRSLQERQQSLPEATGTSVSSGEATAIAGSDRDICFSAGETTVIAGNNSNTHHLQERQQSSPEVTGTPVLRLKTLVLAMKQGLLLPKMRLEVLVLAMRLVMQHAGSPNAGMCRQRSF